MCRVAKFSFSLFFLACREYIVSQTTIRTTTYTDWQTRNGPINHDVQQFVTPNVVVRSFSMQVAVNTEEFCNQSSVTVLNSNAQLCSCLIMMP